MSKARNNFHQRLSAFRSAVDADLIVSHDPNQIIHNARARLLRNGLAVVGYAIIEDFVKSRTSEILKRIGEGTTPFSALPEGLQAQAISGALNALVFQKRFYPRSTEYMSFCQTHANCIASTSNEAYEISGISFGYSQSNISASDVAEILIAFSVDNPWSAIGSVASRAGVGVVSLKDVFENAAERRNRAAHQADTSIEISDLKSFGTDITGLALAFDLLISKALRKILDYDRDYLDQRVKIAGKHVEIRSLEYDGSTWWRETITGRTRAVKRDKDLNLLRRSCISAATVSHQAVIVKGSNGLPSEWYTPDID